MPGDVEAVLARAADAGVEQVVHVGCTRQGHDTALEIAAREPHVYLAIGIHPHDAKTMNDETLERIADLATRPEVVALGETGLDFHYDRSPRKTQLEVFALQVDLARRVDLPLVLHIREAHDAALEVLEAHAPRDNPGIVHCFSGGPGEADRWLDRGWHLSFSGIVTFPGADGVREAARRCPPDRMLLETDAPYLAPAPNRGRPCEPAMVAHTCAGLAAALGEPHEALASRTTRAARALLGLPPPRADQRKPRTAPA
jgi:TatD DNase family protein